MSAKHLSFALLAVLALGGVGAALLLTSPPDDGATAQEWVDEEDVEAGPSGTLRSEQTASRELARAEVESPAAAQAEDDDEPRPRLEVSGRVLGDNGQAVAGAQVSLHYRMSFEALGRGDFGGGPGGGGQGPGDRRFRNRAAGKAVVTDSEGRFSFAGQAYRESRIELHVVHKQFAPAVVQRDWSSREGLLDVGDVIVGAGATVTGFVVDADNRAVSGAEVRFQGENAGFGGGGFGGGRGGRGGRGGNRGENEAEPRLEDLVGAVKTDQTGYFRIEHVPAGRFRLLARAEKYLPGISAALDGKSGEQTDAGQVKLTLGVELRGVVLDQAGRPVADARVEAGAARRGGRGGNGNEGPGNRPANVAEAAAPAGNGEANRNFDWAAMALRAGNNRRTRTNQRGEFTLDSLPPGELQLRVEHPAFVTEERQPIDAQKEPKVTVQLEPALMLVGKVVDDATSQPLGTYAIAVRGMDGGGPGGGGQGGGRGQGGNQGRGRRGGDNGGEVDPQVAAQQAAADAERAQREAFLQQRLGPTGQAPRNAGRPRPHADGNFQLTGLQPGRYAIDVQADDYIGLAHGPIEVVKGKTNEPITIRLRRGSKITGVVEDRVARTPLANVDVSLLLPIEDTIGVSDQPMAMFRPREVGRRITRTRTDEQGKFVFRPQGAGEYWLRIEHDGYNQQLDRNLFVAQGRDLETPTYALVPGSEVTGRVLNPSPGKHYTVTLFSNAGGQRKSARVQSDHTYRIEGVEPGSYFVLLNDGSVDTGGGGGGRRGMGGAMAGGFMSRLAEFANGNAQPDVIVGEGSKVRHDIDAGARAPGVVRGRVALNGAGAAGYDVSLSTPRTETAPAAGTQNGGNQNGGRGQGGRGDMLRGMMNRMLSEQTDADGRFEVRGVPAGSYVLEVRRAGGGGGGRGGRGRGGMGGGSVLHRETIVVTQGGTVERNIAFSTGAVAFEVAVEADGKPIERGNIQLVLAAEASGVAPDQWRSLASFTNATVRNGAANVRDIKTGDWSYRIEAPGHTAEQGTTFVGATSEPTPIKLKLKPAAAPNK